MNNINIISKSNKHSYSITVTTGGGEKYSVCPICSHERKKKTQKCLGFNVTNKIGRCNHCGESFYEKSNYDEIKKLIENKREYSKPKVKYLTIGSKVIEWFKSRGISESTLQYFKIKSGLEYMPQEGKEVNAIVFPYYLDGVLTNNKYRDAKKNFKLEKDCMLTFYNLDAVKEYSEVYIVEGEIDCMSLYEAGIFNVISVPNGAVKNGKINFEYLDNSIEHIFDKSKFIIFTDNDEAGYNLRTQIADRLGRYRCVFIESEKFKDANECLVKYGVVELVKLIKKEKNFVIEGVFTAKDIEDDINDFYYNGLPEGSKIGGTIDDYISFHKGYLTVITGIPGMGKSEFLDFIMCKLSIIHKWKFAIYSPENYPLQLHFSKIAEKLIGKTFGQKYMNILQLEKAKNHFNENYFFIKPKQDFTAESIMNTVSNLALTKGIDAFIIDAWNKLEHNYTENETKYISKELDKIVNFCERNNIHCFLVAHPTKIMKDKQTGFYEVPNLYNISGSANFYNKTANGITVHIDRETGKSRVFIQKVKFKHWGAVGDVSYYWNKINGRYDEFEDNRDNSNWLNNYTQEEIIVDYKTGDVVIKNNISNFDDVPF